LGFERGRAGEGLRLRAAFFPGAIAGKVESPLVPQIRADDFQPSSQDSATIPATADATLQPYIEYGAVTDC
jgi:hypothetical protein